VGAPIACVGAACIDRLVWPSAALLPNGEVPARIARTYGGVARNIAQNLVGLGVSATLIAPVGADDEGDGMLAHARACGIVVDEILRLAHTATATYLAIVEPSGVSYAACDTAIFAHFDLVALDRAWPTIAAGPLAMLDSNLSRAVLTAAAQHALCDGVRIVVVGSSVPTIANLPARLDGITLVCMNEAEAAMYLGAQLDARAAGSALVERGAGAAVVTCGRHGCVVADGKTITALPAVPADVIDVTGAGDALVSGTLARMVHGASLVEAVAAGSRLAALTVAHTGAIRPDLSPELLVARS